MASGYEVHDLDQLALHHGGHGCELELKPAILHQGGAYGHILADALSFVQRDYAEGCDHASDNILALD